MSLTTGYVHSYRTDDTKWHAVPVDSVEETPRSWERQGGRSLCGRRVEVANSAPPFLDTIQWQRCQRCQRLAERTSR